MGLTKLFSQVSLDETRAQCVRATAGMSSFRGKVGRKSLFGVHVEKRVLTGSARDTTARIGTARLGSLGILAFWQHY